MFSFLNIRIGFYLAIRQIQQSSRWTTALIVSVMVLTFLNLVVVTGILVGLVEGINSQYRALYTGDVVVSPLSNKDSIEHTPEILHFLDTLPQVQRYAVRYQAGGSVEANYKIRTDDSTKADTTGAQVVGIDPDKENALTGLSKFVIEGSYLAEGDYDQILIGSLLLDKYSFGQQPGISPLKNVEAGTKVRLTVGGISREVTVKGIIKSKISPLASSIFISDTELRDILAVNDYSASQIAVRLTPQTNTDQFRDFLKGSNVGTYAKVQTYIDAIPNGVADIKNTFAMLGNMISSIGLVVASITIFIVIFVNALTRRKFIGILKGIGISGSAIEWSYMMQSFFYAALGSIIGVVIIYGFLQPAIAAHPINFPFSDGILVATPEDTGFRIALLMIATMVAGYFPARMIVRKNTLDSILGRN